MAFSRNDDHDELMSKALYVDPKILNGGNDDDDLSAPPATAEDYIRRVVREAQQLPDVFVAKDKDKLLVSSGSSVRTRPREVASGSKGPLRDHLPSREWIDQQVADFSDLRLKMVRHRAALKEVRSVKGKRGDDVIAKTPKLKNKQGWACFCFGKDFWNRVVKARGDESVTEEESKSGKRSQSDFDDLEVGEEPLVSYLAKYKPSQIISLLELHAEWIRDLEQVSVEQASWLYAILALVEKPLHGDDIATIRSLAKAARDQRRRDCLQPVHRGGVNHLNLLICIVANYFEQKDLSDI